MYTSLPCLLSCSVMFVVARVRGHTTLFVFIGCVLSFHHNIGGFSLSLSLIPYMTKDAFGSPMSMTSNKMGHLASLKAGFYSRKLLVLLPKSLKSKAQVVSVVTATIL